MGWGGVDLRRARGRGEAGVGGALLTETDPVKTRVATLHACRLTGRAGLQLPDAHDRLRELDSKLRAGRKIVMDGQCGSQLEAR